MKEVYIKTSDLNEWVSKYFNKDLISIEDLIGVIEDLDSEIENLKEKIEDIEQDKEENYKQVSISSQVGINNNDFI